MFQNIAKDTTSTAGGYIDESLPYTQTGNLAHTLKLKRKCPIMLTINSSTRIFKENGIVNGQRGHILDLQFDEKNNEMKTMKIIWVIFPDKETGSLLRNAMKKKGMKHQNPNAVPILKVKQTFQIRGTGIKATRTQFPLVLCFCMTSYKSQGQTLEAVILDYKNCKPKHGQFYVGMTRVRNSSGLFVRNFERSQILCRNDVKRELSMLKHTKQYMMFKTFLEDKIWQNDQNEIKIAYQNVNGALCLDDLDKDINLSHLDFLCLAQSKLMNNNDAMNSKLQNFEIVKNFNTAENNVKFDMIIMKNKWTEKSNESLVSTSVHNFSSTTKIHCVKLEIIGHLSVIFNWTNTKINGNELKEIGKAMSLTKSNFIIADFNLNKENKEETQKINIIEKATSMTSAISETKMQNRALPLMMHENIAINEFQSFFYRNLYNAYPTIGFRYCKSGIISDEYNDIQIRKQNKDYLRNITLPAMKQENSSNKITSKVKTHDYDTVLVDDISQDSATNQYENNDEIIHTTKVSIIKESNLRKLQNDDFLDDELINGYLFLLEQKFKTFLRFSTYFHSDLQTKGLQIMKKQNEYKNINIFDHSKLFIPVNYKNLHWFLLVADTTNIINKEINILVYDSLGKDNVQTKGIAGKKLQIFFKWKFQQMSTDKKSNLKVVLTNMAGQIPHQENGYDCGVFLLMYAKYLAAGKDFNFNQSDMRQFRLKIRNEIMNNKIEDSFVGIENNIQLNDELLKRPKVENINITKKKEKNIEDWRVPCAPPPPTKNYNLRTKKKTNNEEAIIKKKVVSTSIDIKTAEIRSDGAHYQHILLLGNNPGKNLCFSNSVANAILNMKDFREALNEFNPLLEPSNRMLDIWRELHKLGNLKRHTLTSTIALRSLVKQRCNDMDYITEEFDNDRQHDAAEFMNYTLQLLFAANDSAFNLNIQLFGGTIRKYLFCQCQYTDELSVETLPQIWQIPVKGSTLHTCLQEYFESEEIERRCPNCNNNKALQITELLGNPKNIIFQLVRFKAEETIPGNNVRTITKNTNPIMFQEQMKIKDVDYRLAWLICHEGQDTKSGHYICYLPMIEENSFLKMNDNKITTVQLSEKLMQEVYLLGYEPLL